MLPNLHVNEFKRSRPAGGRVSAQEAPIRLEAINIFALFINVRTFSEYAQRFPHFLNKVETLKSMWKAVQDLEIDEYIVLNAMNSRWIDSESKKRYNAFECC
ncbi:MAG: hypothetical protein ACLT98_11105 [Eggerthellaceae bacterium]